MLWKKIKNYLKNSPFKKVYYYLRDFYKYPGMVLLVKKINNQKRKYVILLGTPTFNNLGDHLIAFAELEFLRDAFPNRNIIEIPTQAFLRYEKAIKKAVNKDVAIFITGGGWMGSLWPNDEYIMQKMINTFYENLIIIFPQTVYYDLNTNEGNEVLTSAIRTYHKCKNILLCLRDDDSYEFANEYFPFSRDDIILVPDIALYCLKEKSTDRKNGILVCLRKDREKCIENNFSILFKEYALEHNLSCKKTDTVIKWSIPIWLRKRKIVSVISMFEKQRIVITDRLHGVIFSVIAGTKCIAFNNKTNKVWGVYSRWLKNNNNILFLENTANKNKIYINLQELYNSKVYSNLGNNTLTNQFEYLQNNIKERVYKNET